jgi:hypothetical protein
VSDQVSHPYNTTGEHILNLTFLGERWDDNTLLNKEELLVKTSLSTFPMAIFAIVTLAKDYVM